MDENTFQLRAPAKINLFLHVTGKRDDGYHLLQSLMTFTAAGDALTFTPQKTFSLEVGGIFGPQLLFTSENLVQKAAKALAAEFGVPLSGHITLEKNLPIASGIGGGSSDAAAALLGLAALWELPENPERLQKVAESLGADVPACLARRTVFAEGIGEKLTPLDIPPLHILLVNPGSPATTPEVFKNYAGNFSSAMPGFAPSKNLDVFITQLRDCGNDLTVAAQKVNPAIADVLQQIEHTDDCRLARMSGSGATCFGLYDSAEATIKAARLLREGRPEWWIDATHTL